MKVELAIERLREVIRLRHMALSTEQAYVGWVTRFSRFVTMRAPAGSSERKIEAFLTQLAHQGVSASTQNQAFNALVFFYKHALEQKLTGINALRAKRPQRGRSAPDVAEVRALLASIQDVGGYPTSLIVRLIYGCGLRVNEPLNLRVQDLRLAESRVIIRAAKGDKDRMVALPGRLAKKYPRWQFSPRWAWLFPSHKPCRHPREGHIVRWRCHQKNVQRCVSIASRRLGLCITPHHLRHAYATHSLDRGVNISAIQAAMGHVNVQTTAGYCHAEACSVPSPLEALC